MKAKKTTQKVEKVKATQVRQNFQDVVDQVHYTKKALLITKHNKPWVMIEPLENEE